jgi:hypothetical protein
MKSFLLCLSVSFFAFPLFSQETIIRWEDTKGRKLEISAPTGLFNYGMISGDRIEYGSQYSDNPGKIIKVGDLRIEYGSKYSDNPGKIIKIGEIRIEYGEKYSDNPGKLIRVGGLRVNYSSKYSDNPGLISSIEGSVLRNW